MVKDTFEIVTGTYEEFLLGYNYCFKENKLSQSFAAHDHSASIRCVATCGQYLASGGADDRIFIYDLNTRKLHHTLTHHNATVNSIQFTPNHTHLISASQDGVLAIARIGNWQVEKIWEKAHKGAALLDVAIHSSGKLALTLGADSTLATWNLIKGRQAYVINLRSKCKDAKSLEKILWAEDGIRFLLYGGRFTEVWSIESGGYLKQIQHEDKVTTCFWLDEQILVGYENGQLAIVNAEDGNFILSIQGHKGRIKAISKYKKRLITISSNGEIKIWKRDLQQVASIDTGCRPTCLSILPPIKVKQETEVEEIVQDEEPILRKKKRSE